MAAAEVARTVAAYDAHARAYAEAQPPLPESIRRHVDEFADHVGADARVLEIGSGGGRDADALEERGLRVDRTDITPAFVDLLRERGHDARVLDPLTGDLLPAGLRGRYDGVWAQACLLHVERADLPVVLGRLASAVRAGGLLYLSLKAGEGEAWSEHGAVPAPRHFTYWQEQPLRAALTGAGWRVVSCELEAGNRGERWWEVLARTP